MHVIEVDDVTFGYTDVPAVENVSLTVDDGDFLGLVGPNGSGKSTLIKLMLGLLVPDEGETRLFGRPAHSFPDGERIGYVSQDVGAVDRNIPVTVREVVTMGRFAHAGFHRLGPEDRAAVEGAMERVGITELATRKIGALSGGQRQRVFIARALASEADLLALDEPTVGVDAESREAFYDLLYDLNRQGITILLIEHDIGVVTEHANRIACINRTLFYHGATDSFDGTEVLSAAYGANQRVLEHDHDHSHHDHSYHDHSYHDHSRRDNPDDHE